MKNRQGFTLCYNGDTYIFKRYENIFQKRWKSWNQKNNIKLRNRRCNTGFTLIETVLYIGIFTLTLSSFLLITYRIIQGTSASSYKVIAHEEGEFLIRKFAWALSGVSATPICSPNLSITKPSLAVGQNPLVFDLNSGNIRLARGVATPIILNSANVSITSFTFTCTPPSGGTPAKVQIDFALKDQTYTEAFETIRYLRK